MLTNPAKLSVLHNVTEESLNPVNDTIPRATQVPLMFIANAPPLSPLHTFVPTKTIDLESYVTYFM